VIITQFDSLNGPSSHIGVRDSVTSGIPDAAHVYRFTVWGQVGMVIEDLRHLYAASIAAIFVNGSSVLIFVETPDARCAICV
jgi:hypothetical protein